MAYGEKTKELWKNPEYKAHMISVKKNKPSNSKGKHWKVKDTTKMHHKAWNKIDDETLKLYSVDWTKTLRISIRERDHYTCQLCGERQGDLAHSVHHIDYDKKNCNPDNLITLCLKCHTKTNFNRDYWFNHFNNKNI